MKDKDAAFTTLYHVLVTLSKVCAPFIPFLSEEIYQNLVVNNVPGAPESVHLCDFPTADESAIDADMEAQMDALVEVVQLGRVPQSGEHQDPSNRREALRQGRVLLRKLSGAVRG